MSPAERVIDNEQVGGKSSDANYSFTHIDSSKYNLEAAVKTPLEEDKWEWIANNIFDFHKQVCMLFGTVSDDCTGATCPEMTAGQYRYTFFTGLPKRYVDYCASDYIHHLLDWVGEQLDDKDIFPTAKNDNFPSNFKQICKRITLYLSRVYAHIYHHHLPYVKSLTIEAHMNTSFKHFIYFIKAHNLVPDGQLEPLREYIQNLT